MTASKILSPVLAAVLVTAGASAFAGGYNNYPELPQPTSTLTRAQVQADLVQVQHIVSSSCTFAALVNAP